MKLFEGKSPNERNKIIAAIALGLMCLVVFYFAFGRSLFSSSATTITVKASPTPKANSTTKTDPDKFAVPTKEDQYRDYASTPVVYNRGGFGAPDPGRNIFAFYEPPVPTPYVPTPFVAPPTPAPPPPTPYPMQIAFVNPQTIYAGSKGFRMEISGDLFTPDSRVYFSQQELPTTFVSAQRLTADVPGVLITNDGPRQILVQTLDGKLYSNQVMLDVQPPPKPQFQYIGMIARQRGNNDTAYFQETGKPQSNPFGARLNDVVVGRFRVLSISNKEVILEDVSLGFRHKVALFTPPPGSVQPVGPTGRPAGFPNRESYVPFDPGQPSSGSNSRIPGIPDNIPRYIPPGSNSNSTRRAAPPKQDVDDDDDTDN